MSANLLEIYESVGDYAKAGAEQASAATARIAEVVRDGGLLLAEGVVYHVNHSTQALGAVVKSRTPEEAAAAQRAWLEGVVARVADDVKAGLDLTGRLLSEVAVVKPASDVAPTAEPALAAVEVEPAPAPAPAPVAVEAEIDAAPAVVEDAVEEAVVAEAVVAETVVEEAVAAEEIIAEVAAEEPVVVETAAVEAVVESAPVPAVETAPVVEAAPKPRTTRRAKGQKAEGTVAAAE